MGVSIFISSVFAYLLFILICIDDFMESFKKMLRLRRKWKFASSLIFFFPSIYRNHRICYLRLVDNEWFFIHIFFNFSHIQVNKLNICLAISSKCWCNQLCLPRTYFYNWEILLLCLQLWFGNKVRIFRTANGNWSPKSSPRILDDILGRFLRHK